MSKSLYIAEKPSVAQQFADALKIRGRRGDGYIESEDAIVTWCVGHLVMMSYPDAYDMKFKRWSLQTLPFLPKEFKYEIIPGVARQFAVVKGLLNRRMWIRSMSARTQGGKENISTVWWLRWRGKKTSARNVCGSIPRQRRRSSGNPGKQRMSRNMIIFLLLPICAQRKIT